MSLSVTDIISLGEESLLGGNFHKANDVFAAALFIDPSCRPYLWQRGLSLYYCCQYEEGMAQFETDTRVNGGDVEEILWHFICKVKIMGYDGAVKDGFLPLSHSSAVPPPLHQVLAFFKGYGTVEDILDVATPPSGQGIICSYNGANALGYAHFYIGLYYELHGMYQLAHGHFEKAIECKNEDFMGKLMIMHFGLFKSSIGCQPLIDPASYKYAPPIIYGGWQLSSGHNQSVNHNVDAVISQLLKAVDMGINAFDCGDIYTGVEEIYGMMIGSHISRGGKRSDISINTKLVPDRDVILRGGVDLSYVTGVIQRSLNHLGTSYIDLVQFHWWAWSCDGYIDVAKLLMSFKEKQIIRQIGLTNFDLEHTREIVTAGVEVTTLQVQLSLLDRRPIDSGLLSYCVLNDISVLAYGVLAGGFLTDKWIGKSQPLKFSNRSLVKYHLIISEFGSWGLYQRLLSVLRVIGDRHSPLEVLYSNGCSRIFQTVSVAMVAIAYVLSLPGVGGVILGSLNINHIEESLFACQLKLTEQDIHDISLVVEKRCGPNGPVYDMERDPDGLHGRIMKYNLNQLNKSHHLEELCKRYLHLYFSAYPVEATRSGYRYPMATPTKCHTSCIVDSYDHRLNITAKDEVNVFIERVRKLLDEAGRIEIDDLTCDQRVDLKLIQSRLNLELVKWLEVKMHQKDPSIYLPFDAINYLLPTWGNNDSTDDDISSFTYPGVASLSLNQRLHALVCRLSKIPQQLQDGIYNLSQPALAFTERAIKLCESFELFLRRDMIKLIDKLSTNVCDEMLTREVSQFSLIASLAVVRYKEILVKDILPKSRNDSLAIGRVTYDKLLYYEHFITDSSILLQLGNEVLSSVKKELADLAFEVDPNKSWSEITEEMIRPFHPSSDELLSSYVAEIQRAKVHMTSNDLIPPLPVDEQVMGFHTPPFLIPFSPFGDFINPVPFAGSDSSSVTGYLMLHSIASQTASKEEEEELLRAHDYTWISIISPHECYPGHHVQMLFAQNHQRILRKFHQSTYFYEGWGLYCEQLAYETGFFHKKTSLQNESKLMSPAMYNHLARLTQLRLKLWRAARLVLDVKFHRGEMSLEDCQEFLCHEVMFNRQSVAGEVFMYASRPTYATCYIAGYDELMKLRKILQAQFEKESKTFSLKKFHAAILNHGSIPFPLLYELLSLD